MASVQFNLLPDVKLEYIRTQRSKNLVGTIALLAGAAALAIFLIVLFTVEGVQRKQLNDSNSAITQTTNQLKAVTGLDQILTVQNQLNTLSTLHHQKHAVSRLFTYLAELTPSNAHISQLNLDTTTNSLKISGAAKSQDTVNTFIDALKFTTYKVGATDSAHTAFPSVIESTFSISSGSVDYGLTITYDPQLFSNSLSATPTLTVPKQITTRSALEDPSNALFNSKGSGGGN